MSNKKEIFYLTVKDHSVSKESFDLYIDYEFQFLKTLPKPELNHLESYYESEDYISHTDSQKNFFEKTYQLVRNVSLKQKRKLVSKLSNGKQILDIGCGTGDFLKELNLHGFQTTGFEPNSKAATIATQKGINLIDDYKKLPDATFDVITMWHVLEHVYDLHEQIAELKRLIKPNGVIIIAVPNFKSFDAFYYGKDWAAFDVPRHLWHFSKNSIRLLFGQNKFKVVQILPMYFDAFYVSMLSEKYRKNSLSFLRGIFVGSYSNLKGLFTGEFSSQIYIIKP